MKKEFSPAIVTVVIVVVLVALGVAGIMYFRPAGAGVGGGDLPKATPESIAAAKSHAQEMRAGFIESHRRGNK